MDDLYLRCVCLQQRQLKEYNQITCHHTIGIAARYNQTTCYYAVDIAASLTSETRDEVVGASLLRSRVDIFFGKLSLFQAVGDVVVDAGRTRKKRANTQNTPKYIGNPEYIGKTMSDTKKTVDLFQKRE